MTQRELGEFDADAGDGDTDARDPVDEAQAVAGNGGHQADVVDVDEERYPDPTGEVTIAVFQVDYTIVGSGADERPILHVFGRTPENELEHIRVHEFRPYFYAPTDSLTDEKLDIDAITGTEDGYESIRGTELTKIYGRTPRDVGEIRDRFDHYEADILFPNRLLIDKDIRSGVRVPERRGEDGAIDIPHTELQPTEVTADPRINTFDIEVDDRRGFPEDGEEPIVCLTSHDSYRDEYIAWLYNAPDGDVPSPESLAHYDLLDEDVTVEVRAFDEEAAMLDAFIDYIQETDPDITTGWNFADFDAPYLLDRLEALDPTTDHDLDPDRLSRVYEVWRSDWQGPNIKGRVVFDLLYAYQRTQFSELESYRLDAVAEQELGIGKERYTGDIGDLWEQDPERLLEYNLRDVELCVEIDRKQEIIPFWQEVATFVGCKLEDATTPGDAVDMYVLHKAHGEFALPSKGQQEAEDFEGGAVFDPITGVREMVSVLDLACFSGDTQVMTPSGVRTITDIDVGDEIYTLDPDTFECEVTAVTETHAYENTYGQLHHIDGQTHDFKVTENHRFLTSKKRGWDDLTPADFSVREYRDIPQSERFAFPNHEPMAGRTPETFSLVDAVEQGHVVIHSEADLRSFSHHMPAEVTDRLDLIHGSSAAMGLTQTVGKYLLPVGVYRDHRDVIDRHADEVMLQYATQHREVPLSFGMADWLEFLGWYVTEGSLNSKAGSITLHQSDPDGRETIRSLLDRMELNYSTDDRSFNLSNQLLHDWLERHCGKGYANKHLPEWVFELDATLLAPLLETLIEGDGQWSKEGLGKFWTKSDRLKDDIARIAVQCGHKPTVTKQQDGTWYVSIGKRGSFNKSVNETVEAHDGQVYCVTAEDNHVILAGRNGHFQWVGQSLYPMAMVTMNASPETKVGEDYDGETYVAPNGQRFRKEPDGIMREMVDELLEEREEKKTLRDENDPDSEVYQRYDRQQAAVKVIMNCFTPDTEVLTPDGVTEITDLEIGDEVYSLDPETMEMEVKPVTETHAYPEYRGDLVDIQTSKIDFRVTPNHRMLVRKNDKNGITEDEWRFVEAGELYDYCNYEMPHGWSYDHPASLGDTIDLVDLLQRSTDTDIVVSDGGAKLAAQYGIPNISREVDTDTFLEFLAWFITEGNVYRADSANYRIKIAQEHTNNRERIVSLIDSFVDSYYTTDRYVMFNSRPLAEYLDVECGHGSENKRIPELVFESSAERKQHFLERLVAGDGHWEKEGSSFTFSTKSTELRDDFLRLCTELGYTAHHTRDSGVWRVRVSFNSKNSFRMHRSGAKSQAENGVYCVSVKDNNTLLVGRNGKYQFSGNSLYGVSGWDRFRLYDKENAAAVTATGREVIEFTEEAVNELDKDVIYGDSVTGDRPIVVQDPDGIVRILPIEDLFERAGTDIDHEVVITADGAPAGSANLPKERRTMNGWKALSVAETGHSEWQPIEQIIRHEPDKPVVKLQHKFGESTTTRDHSYVIEDDGALAEASPTDVQTPLRVSGMPDIENILELDLYELLRGYEREYEDGRGTGGITVKTKRIHANDEYVWFGHEHYDERDSTVKVKRHISLKSEDGNALLRLLGAYVTEGSASTIETTNSKFGARIAESNSGWLEQLRKDYDRLFENATANLIAGDSRVQRSLDYETQEGESSVTYEDQTLKLQMMNELSAVFFRELAGQTSRGKRIPSFIFHLPESRQDVFLTTVIEGDGSRKFPRYSDEYADRNFDFETTSRELAAGLSMLLTQRGKKHSFKYRDEKDSYTIRTVDTYGRGRDPILTEVDHDGYVYDLDVAANDNFVDGVGGIVLHNTDSIMLELGGDLAKEDAIETSFDIEDHINSRYDAFAREELNAEFHRFEIEFEKLYRRFFQAGKKKRYAGHIVWSEGKDV
ncbi:MAG: 3'-5' exonuclease, partial [Halobacteriales archaeon]